MQLKKLRMNLEVFFFFDGAIFAVVRKQAYPNLCNIGAVHHQLSYQGQAKLDWELDVLRVYDKPVLIT